MAFNWKQVGAEPTSWSTAGGREKGVLDLGERVMWSGGEKSSPSREGQTEIR